MEEKTMKISELYLNGQAAQAGQSAGGFAGDHFTARRTVEYLL